MTVLLSSNNDLFKIRATEMFMSTTIRTSD